MVEERFAVAPMMEITTPCFRAFLRSLTRKAVLYTEMVVDDCVLHTPNLDFFIGHHNHLEPSVIQLGGSDPEMLALAAERCDAYGGYNEININAGCPSNRVSQRCFGAQLMLNPDLMRQIVSTVSRRVSVPVTVKCRLGVKGERESYEELCEFIRAAHEGGANKFIIHARDCVLNGLLTTKQNRDVPPLRYDVVRRLVQDFPDLTFVLNGGVMTLEEGLEQLRAHEHAQADGGSSLHGIMIGRAACNNPTMLATVDSLYYGSRDPCFSRRDIVEQYSEYCDFVQSDEGPTKETNGRFQKITTSLLLAPIRDLFAGMRGNKKFKQALNDHYQQQVRETMYPLASGIFALAMSDVEEEFLNLPLGNSEAPITASSSAASEAVGLDVD